MNHPSMNHLPSWMTEPCPEWCAAAHTRNDLPDDRLHFSRWLRPIPLPNAKPVEIGEPPRSVTRTLVIYVEQHITEDTPRVILTEEHGGQVELRLTAEQACELGIALLHGRGIITDENMTLSSDA